MQPEKPESQVKLQLFLPVLPCLPVDLMCPCCLGEYPEKTTLQQSSMS